jgi:tetratricopeptide (TPR) repeat protein
MNAEYLKIYELAYEKKDYETVIDKIKEALSHNEDKNLETVLAFCYTETHRYKEAAELYHKLELNYQEGFCHLLSGNDKKAKEIWLASENNPGIIWGKIIAGILESQVDEFPTYFQIRNNLESTLTYLFEAKKTEYLEKIIGAKQFLAEFNIESYRIIGKVLLENNYTQLAKEYLEKAITELPQDYEAYYFLGLWYYQNKEPQKAKYFFQRCLDINEYYCSASNMIDKINEID